MENEKSNLTDEELAAGQIALILEKIRNEADPEEIESLKKTIRKNVPFFMRGTFSAYLLKAFLEGGRKRPRPAAPEKKKAAAPVAAARTEKAQDAPIAQKPKAEKPELPEGSKTLYLNVGKMKHLYAKDLSKLIQSEIGVTREDIYAIRIHDKYSFVTMSEENCQKAIEKLNGKEINGRVAQVNFSNR